MNIKDINETIEIPKAIWETIFKKQESLIEKYKEIEGMPTNVMSLDNINTKRGQIMLKDFAWRVTEELAEAYETIPNMSTCDIDEGQDFIEHFKEELIDALHFLVELTLLAGHVNFKPKRINTPTVNNPWNVVYHLGLMCNTLKNKPWKQTQMLTDREKFTHHLDLAWSNFYELLQQEVGSDTDIYQYYFKKNKVNQFRQRSNY